MIRSLLVLLVPAILCPVSGRAQVSDERFQALRAAHPNADQVILVDETHVTIEIVDGELAIREARHEEVLLLDEAAARGREHEVRSSSFHPLLDIEAWVEVPTDRRSRRIEVEDFKTRDLLDGPNFHDDRKGTVFTYHGLTAGAVRGLSTVHGIEDPLFLSARYFAHVHPIERAVFTITCPPEVRIEHRVLHADTIDLVHTIEEGKRSVVHRWEARDLPRVRSEGSMPRWAYFVPQVLVRVASYEVDGRTIPVVDGLDGLQRRYEGFIDGVNATPDDGLIALSDSIVRGATSELDKVRAVYQWVQDNIKYVAFEAGYQGLIPRQAVDIDQRRFGDCKDMASIQKALLEAQGIEGAWTWIGSRNLPYDYTDFACVQVDDHMILTYMDTEGPIFLDGTSSEIPFGMPSAFIQGKEALIRLGPDSFIVHRVPVVEAERSILADSVTVRWTGERIEGSGRGTFSGYYRGQGVLMLRGEPEDERRRILKSYFEKGSNAFRITSFTDGGQTDRDVPYTIDYGFEVDDYVLELDDELYVNLNLDRPYRSGRIEEDRHHPVERDHHGVLRNVVRFEVPDGYTVADLPQDDRFDHELFSFETAYEHDTVQNIIRYEQRLTTRFLLLDPASFTAWNEMVDRLNDAYKRSVILARTN